MEEAFLAALHADPNDEPTWLALSDWLEETGQADRAELARLVRRLRTLPLHRRQLLPGRMRMRPRHRRRAAAGSRRERR